MNKTEQDVKAAAMFYAARDAAKFILQDSYAESMGRWQQLVRAVMASTGKAEVSACLVLLEQEHANPHAQMLLMAATVEMLEPSTSPKRHEEVA